MVKIGPVSEPHEILTVGHSTHPIERFLALLRAAGVAAIADVRRYPASRRNPQFGAEALANALSDAGIAYAGLGEELGGRRGSARRAGARDRSEPRLADNSAWRSASFRAYANHMATAEFATGLGRLEELARARRTAVMCAEGHWTRCHRRLIADALAARGWRVLHLLPDGRLEEHRVHPDAVVTDGRLSYPAQPALDV
jgi:uncharacterized protein (DUF488 family)